MPIYASIEFQHATQYQNAESVRALCTSLYDSGADGISMFNFPTNGRHYHQEVYSSACEGIEKPETACKKPLLFSVAHWRVRKDMDLPGILPVTLETGQSVEIDLRLPAAAFPACRSRLVFYVTQRSRVTLNGEELETYTRDRSPELFLKWTATLPGVLSWPRPPLQHTQSFRFSPGLLKAGGNSLVIHNDSEAPMHIHRINLGLW